MDKRTRDRMIEIAAQIKVKRDELATLEREFDLIMGEPAGKLSAPAEGTAAQVIQTTLSEFSDKVFEAEEIAKLHELDIQVVRTTLARLAGADQITRVARGKYQANGPRMVGSANGPQASGKWEDQWAEAEQPILPNIAGTKS